MHAAGAGQAMDEEVNWYEVSFIKHLKPTIAAASIMNRFRTVREGLTTSSAYYEHTCRSFWSKHAPSP
jgi:hypothetical protein